MNNKIIIKESKTVKEFIEILKQLPQDYQVRVWDDKEIEIRILDDYYDNEKQLEPIKAVSIY